MLKRYLYQNLLAWKERQSRLPLILRGARQVGKTTLITEFGKKEFSQFINLNLEEKEYQSFFTGSFENAIRALEFHCQRKINPEGTLLFLDEIQASPDAINMLRFFYEKMPSLHVICAGSLLEKKLSKKNISFPTGRVEYLFLAPMSFAEFLEARGNPVAMEMMKGPPDTIPENIHSMLLEEVHSYFRIGGLPGIVNTGLQTGSEAESVRMHTDLFQSLLDDIGKYVHKSELKYIELAFGAAPFHIAERMTYANFHNSEYRSREMKEAFDVLEKVFLAYRCAPTGVARPPVLKKFNVSPKLFFFDIGLANSKLKRPYRSDLHEVHPQSKGDFTEQFVFQEFLAAQTQVPDIPCFWAREKKGSNAEVDFCVEWNNLLIPVEVKSGSTGSLKSLGVYLKEAPHKIAVKISSNTFSVLRDAKTDYGEAFTLIEIPLYLAWRTREILDIVVTAR